MATLTFHGAARTVTGSKFLLEAGDARVLVDCGLFQGLKQLRELNWRPMPFDVKSLDAVVLTHAHLDHTGYLPRLAREGYYGPIFGTEATNQLTEIILFDSAHCQEMDAEYANRKGFSKHKPALPLYEERDVQQTVGLLDAQGRGQWFSPAGQIWMRYHDAGHLLGSNLIEVEVRDRTPPLRIVFSGDVGRYDGPLYHDPKPPPECDYLICESTYGDRDHPPESILDGLTEVVTRAVGRGGVMLFAAFAVGRAQQLIYLLQVLKSAGRIPDVPIYLDSPMACDATMIYRQHREDHDLSEGDLDPAHPALDGKSVRLCRTTNESKALNQTRGPAVIISSSGMMTGGRILHHLKQRLPHERNTIVLGGFQAVGTRGRSLQDGAKWLRIHGQDVSVRAAIEQVPGLSGHADRAGLVRWLQPLRSVREVFLVHGEVPSAESLAQTLRAQRGWNVHVPDLGQTYSLT
ncbi:MAG TPA: MBL fold metallo-hydrolase [Lacipirellulaceae bacterium]|nr:MBL fold metallo-hydrolase [Lacipirellulaceae bacterium]